MEELIVIAAHGDEYLRQCVASLGDARTVVVDTGPKGPVPGRHPTGAYLWAYEHVKADRYLFIQDSMTALEPDPCAWFRDQCPAVGAVAWGLFSMAYDEARQESWVRDQYGPGPGPERGIVGPIFYTPRASLDVLADRGLLPRAPSDRIEAQGTERAWAWAFHAAGMPVAGPMYDKPAMGHRWGPFRKTWGGRP